jgi:putative transposase
MLKLPVSTYYYMINNPPKQRHEQSLVTTVREICAEQNFRLGYRPVKFILERDYGIIKNHKKIRDLMKINKFQPICTKKRPYISFDGRFSNAAPNLNLDKIIASNGSITFIQNFKASGPFKKLGTDVTEFSVEGVKVYLAIIIDFFTGELLAFNASLHPDMKQQADLLEMLKATGINFTGASIHSDQGHQYQRDAWINAIHAMGFIQSMSRKGNCLDNAPTESFFSRLKYAMYWGRKYKSVEDLINAIIKFIAYYNKDRINNKRHMSPTEFRNQHMLVNTSIEG